MSGRTLLIGCGRIISGDVAQPFVEADSILLAEGRIAELGTGLIAEPGDAVVEVGGATVAPGLVDAHSHPVIGDFTPRQTALGWTSRALHGGVTSLVSAGETHWPGRRKDGPEAAAICGAAHLTSRGRSPGSARVFGGALLLDSGITERHLDELHALGVRMLGEIGLGSEKDPSRLAELVAYARRLGWVAPLHFGGASVPGSSVVGLDLAMALDPNVISHANGGPTARPVEEVLHLIDHGDTAIELVFAGNTRTGVEIVRRLSERNEMHRLQFGTDTPSGTGVVPIGLLRVVTEMAALGGVDPAVMICAATGSTANRYGLVPRSGDSALPERTGSPDALAPGSPLGRIAEGGVADLVILDTPLGSETPDALEAMRSGNVPAVAAVFVDGELEISRSSVTPPPANSVTRRP